MTLQTILATVIVSETVSMTTRILGANLLSGMLLVVLCYEGEVVHRSCRIAFLLSVLSVFPLLALYQLDFLSLSLSLSLSPNKLYKRFSVSGQTR